ncbi:MAG: hypothetical protein U0931_29970 [Vulcanimicrobiota bacterium]
MQFDDQVDQFVSEATCFIAVKGLSDLSNFLRDPQVNRLAQQARAGLEPKWEYWSADRAVGRPPMSVTVCKDGRDGLLIDVGLQKIRIDSKSAQIDCHVPFSSCDGSGTQGVMKAQLRGRFDGARYLCTQKSYLFQSERGLCL